MWRAGHAPLHLQTTQKVDGGDASGLGGPTYDSDPSFGISMKSGIAIGIAIPGFIVVLIMSIMSFLYWRQKMLRIAATK